MWRSELLGLTWDKMNLQKRSRRRRINLAWKFLQDRDLVDTKNGDAR